MTDVRGTTITASVPRARAGAALTTLMNERTAIGGSGGGSGGPKRGGGAIAGLTAIWEKAPEWVRTPQNRDDVMKLWIKAEALRLTNMRASQAEGRQSGP